MRINIYCIPTLILIMGILSFNKQSKEDKFWTWFSANENVYYTEVEDGKYRKVIFDKLANELQKIHEDLSFEFSPIHENGVRELTISAEGIIDVFPIVESLIRKAPKLVNWKFNAFRQRVPGDDIELELGEKKIGYSDIYYRYKDGDYGEIGIELNIRNYDESRLIQHATYILLDGLIGEYDLTVGIDWIEWVKLDESTIPSLSPIIELRTLIDTKK